MKELINSIAGLPALPVIARRYGLDSDEILSELCLRNSRTHARLLKHLNESAYVARTLNNLAKSILRRSCRFPKVLSGSEIDESESLLQKELPTLELEKLETEEKCRDAVCRLPRKYQDVINECFFEESPLANMQS